MKRKLLPLILMIAVLTVCFTVFASASNGGHIKDNIYFLANSEDSASEVRAQQIGDGTYYMFLPSSADFSDLAFYTEGNFKTMTISADESVTVTDGQAFDFTALFNDFDSLNGEYTVVISAYTSNDVYSEFQVTIMKSANVRSMYLVSDDPINQGRAWVDTDKSNEATGLMCLIGEDGSIDYSNKLTQLKGRGNSTFTDFIKKPYQIKIAKKADLIGGNSDEANKKWVLLANAADITLVHNAITFDLARELNMPFTPNYEAIDLYYDGEYRGSYLLTEKTEVDSSRIDIEDLDGLIEDANDGNDAYENPVSVTKTIASKGEEDAAAGSKGSYKYIDGLNEPKLEYGLDHHAYLLEIDFIYRYADELSGFVTNRGQAVVTKDSEYLTKDTGAYISQFWQDFEDAVYSADGYNKTTEKYYYDYCDLDSLVKLYLINELGKNYDSFRSSAYFYLPEDENIMYAGPVWDYDICYGTGYNGNRQIAANPENFFSTTKYMLGQLMKIESFRDAVKETLDSENGEFYNAVQKLLGDDGSISVNSAEVYQSQKMNYKLWDISDKVITALFCDDECNYDNGISFLKYFVSERINWLSETTSTWSGNSYEIKTDPSFAKTYRFHANVVSDKAVSATCTEDGLTAGTHCADCGTVYKKQTVVAATGHSWTEADCENPKTCMICGVTEGEALGHDYVQVTDDPMCSETCLVYRCSHCSKSMYIDVAPKIIYGDMNGDGIITAADARIALRLSAGIESSTDELVKLGDMNSDGKLTAADARLILRKSAQIS